MKWLRRWLTARDCGMADDPKGRTPAWRRGVADGRNVQRAAEMTDRRTRHRTRVVRTELGFWWWQCAHCPDHFGYGNRWPRVLAAAEAHALGRRRR